MTPVNPLIWSDVILRLSHFSLIWFQAFLGIFMSLSINPYVQILTHVWIFWVSGADVTVWITHWCMTLCICLVFMSTYICVFSVLNVCVRMCLQTYSVNIYNCMFYVCALSGLWRLQAIWQICVKFFSPTDQNTSTSRLPHNKTTVYDSERLKTSKNTFHDDLQLLTGQAWNVHTTRCRGKRVYYVTE